MRVTRPPITPLRVSISAFWPIWMSFACVSAILISALRRPGLATRARLVPGATCWPTSTGHELQHAAQPGADVQFVLLLPLELQHSARLIDARLLHGELRAARLGTARELLLRDLVPDGELLGVDLRLPNHQIGDELIFRQRLVHLGLHLRLVVVRVDVGGRRPLAQQIVLHLHPEVGERRLGRQQLELGILHLLVELRVGQLEDDSLCLHRRARPEDDSFHAPLRRGRNPPDVLGHERPEPANLPDHRPALDGVRPQRGGFDRGRRRLELREAEGDPSDHEDGDCPRKSRA